MQDTGAFPGSGQPPLFVVAKGQNAQYFANCSPTTAPYAATLLDDDFNIGREPANSDEQSTLRKTLRFNFGGYGNPAAITTDSNGDKIVLFSGGGSPTFPITYDGRMGVGISSNMWFKSSGVGTVGVFDFYSGDAPTLAAEIGLWGATSGSYVAAPSTDLYIGSVSGKFTIFAGTLASSIVERCVLSAGNQWWFGVNTSHSVSLTDEGFTVEGSTATRNVISSNVKGSVSGSGTYVGFAMKIGSNEYGLLRTNGNVFSTSGLQTTFTTTLQSSQGGNVVIATTGGAGNINFCINSNTANSAVQITATRTSFTSNNNGDGSILVSNASGGASAYQAMGMSNDGGSASFFFKFSSGYSTSGLYGANILMLRNDTGNFVLNNLANSPIIFAVNSAEVARFTSATLTVIEAFNFVLGTTTGTKIGTATSQKIGFWNATPIVQPTTGVAAATFVANTSGIVNDTATWDGYTVGQVVKALRNEGLLA